MPSSRSQSSHVGGPHKGEGSPPSSEPWVPWQESTPVSSSHKFSRAKRIDELYDIIAVVGAGAFGIVIACRDKKSGKKFALKIAALNKKCVSQAAASLMREKKMLMKR